MSTGSAAADARIARIVAAAPDFTDEQHALIKRLMRRTAQPATTEQETTATTAASSQRQAA